MIAADQGGTIPLGHKFACVALANADHSLDSDLTLPSGVGVAISPPFDIDIQWDTWLGKLRTEVLRESNFLVLTSAPSERPDLLDGENEELRARVVRVLHGIFINCVPYHEGSLELSGANVNGHVGVRVAASRDGYLRSQGDRPPAVDIAMLQEADMAADGLATVAQSLRSGSREFGRVGRGVRSWLLGVREPVATDRLHLFVRAIEAFINPRLARSKRDFSHRAQTFVGAAEGNKLVLDELYGLRSCAEHLHDWDCGLEDIIPSERALHGIRRAFEAELIAGRTLLRILSNPPLLEHFRTPDLIKDFWALPDRKRRELWGQPIDYQAIANSRFFPADVPS
jgi:hypothetical protein